MTAARALGLMRTLPPEILEPVLESWREAAAALDVLNSPAPELDDDGDTICRASD